MRAILARVVQVIVEAADDNPAWCSGVVFFIFSVIFNAIFSSSVSHPLLFLFSCYAITKMFTDW